MGDLARKLNAGQLSVLDLLYRFRFGTNSLIARSLSFGEVALQFRLKILVEQGYIARRYEKSYKRQGKPASYSLLKKGLRALEHYQDLTVNQSLLVSSYHDSRASDLFISRQLLLLGFYCGLKAEDRGDAQLFTKRELADYGHFPQPLPDAYLSIKEQRYFIEVVQNTMPNFKMEQRILRYMSYADSDQWAVTGTPLPILMALCESVSAQRRFQRALAKNQEAMEWTELKVIVNPSKQELADLTVFR